MLVIALGALLCTGIVLTLCTSLCALFGMLLRGGKTCKDSHFSTVFSLNFSLLLLITRMFITFTYLFVLFVVDADLKSVWGFFLDSVRIGRYAIFANVLKNRCMDAICY